MFDFDKPGTEPPEHEVGIEFHRTGIDLIRQLVSQAVPATPRPPSAGGSDDGREGGGDGSRDGETQPETASPPLPAPPPIPRLEVAAFLVAERARPTSDPGIESSIRHDDGGVVRPQDASTPGIEPSPRHDDGGIVRPQDGSALDAAGESSVPVEKDRPAPAGRNTNPRMDYRRPGRMRHATLASGPGLSRLHPERFHPRVTSPPRPRPETFHPFGRRSGRRTEAAPDPAPSTTPSSARPARLRSTGCSAGLPAARSRSI